MKKNPLTLNARQLRNLKENKPLKIQRNPVYFVLDNVYDTYNIGGLFRLADALSISRLYICGESETPPNHKIVKASIGTYKIVPWAYKGSVLEALADIKEEAKDIYGKSLVSVAIEQTASSIPYAYYQYQLPLALVVGNETEGVSQEALKACTAVVEIPMFGINTSLNVIVSAAIVGYYAYQQRDMSSI